MQTTTLTAQSEDATPYHEITCPMSATEREVVNRALDILRLHMNTGPLLNSPAMVREYLQLKIGALPHEVFVVMFLDAQHRLIACEEVARGTLTQTSVYPREVVKAALLHNACGVIVAHNHPTGVTTPSRADEFLTQSLKSSLSLVDVRVLDHIVCGAGETFSFAERGLL